MWIVIAIVVVALLLFVVLNNMVVARKNAVENAFSSIDVMLKKRYDLIPNLVQTVKTYMNYEKDTLTKITELRAKATLPGVSADEKINLENQLNTQMRSIMVAVENYPDLKANTNFLQLQGSWNEIEEQISAARRSYNAAVNDFNNSVEMFPTNIFANMKGYKRKPSIEIPEEERKNISAKELFNA